MTRLTRGHPVLATLAKTVPAAVLLGLSIVFIGTWPWVALIGINVREHPEVPWAALITACWLVVLLLWLSGRGWTTRSSAFRRTHLRLWRPQPGAWSGEGLTTILGLIAALVGLYVIYVLSARGRPPVDASAYPTTVLRFSALFTGAVMSGVMEEAAFRGYMQSHLERIGPTFAILVTSVVFTLAHATHGLAYVLAVAPGFFLASVVYGYLAMRSGSIIPGMVIHCAGDLAFAYFALLGGDYTRLFAP